MNASRPTKAGSAVDSADSGPNREWYLTILRPYYWCGRRQVCGGSVANIEHFVTSGLTDLLYLGYGVYWRLFLPGRGLLNLIRKVELLMTLPAWCPMPTVWPLSNQLSTFAPSRPPLAETELEMQGCHRKPRSVHHTPKADHRASKPADHAWGKPISRLRRARRLYGGQPPSCPLRDSHGTSPRGVSPATPTGTRCRSLTRRRGCPGQARESSALRAGCGELAVALLAEAW